MKKFGALFLLTTVSAFAAHADCNWNYFCALGQSTSHPIELSEMLSSNGYNSLNQEFIAQVRDQAAEYVAADGQEGEGALLSDAINMLRSTSAQAASLSDLEIARDLMK